MVYPFGPLFNAAHFLEICAEVDCTIKYPKGEGYAGSIYLFMGMVEDLILENVNMKDFLADSVPADMETNQTLLELLACTQGDGTRNYVINYMKVLSFRRNMGDRHRRRNVTSASRCLCFGTGSN